MEYVGAALGLAALVGLIGWFIWRWTHHAGREIQVGRARELFALQRDHLQTLFFDAASATGKPISRNVYWLSTQTDELDWAHSNWYLTPVTRYADLSPLQSLPTVTSEVRATMRHEGAEDIATVTLTVPPSSKAVALFQHVSIKRSAGGEPMLPILWSENDVTLWPGESITLTAHFATPGAATPVVEVSGWNVPTISAPVAVESRTAALQERNH